MFVFKKNESYLKGFKIIEPGTFKGKNGEDIAYDGYKQITLSVPNKNDELVDIKCRIANTSEGDVLYMKLRQQPLMTKILIDGEVQVSASGNAKYFITNFEVAK